MKKAILFLLIVGCVSITQAQQTFQTTMKSVGNTVSIYVKPMATGCTFVGELEFYVRYPSNQNLTFSNFQAFGFFSAYNYSLNNFTPTIREGSNYSIRIGFPVLLAVCTNTVYKAGEEYKICSFQVAGTGNGAGGSSATLQLVHEANTKTPYKLKLTDGANNLLPTNLSSYFYPNTSNSVVGNKNYYYYELNNIALPTKQPCADIKTVKAVVTTVSNTTAKIGGPTLVGETYVLQYRPKGTSTWTMVTRTANSPSLYIDIANLKPATTYEYALRCTCTVFYDFLLEFKTQESMICAAPTTPLQISYDPDGMWFTAPYLTGEYEIQYRVKGTQSWQTSPFGPNSIRQFMGLSPKTVYEYQIRLKCAPNVFSPYSAIWTFTSN